MPATGTYSVVISGHLATDAGAYNLYYVESTKGVSSGSLTSGATATGSMPVNGLISYQFSGTAGQMIFISVAAPSYTGHIYVYNPNGSANTNSTNRVSVNPIVAGTYTVVLQAANITDSGSYSLYYVRGSSGVSNGSLVNGSPASGTLPANGLISYQLAGTAGQGIADGDRVL